MDDDRLNWCATCSRKIRVCQRRILVQDGVPPPRCEAYLHPSYRASSIYSSTPLDFSKQNDAPEAASDYDDMPVALSSSSESESEGEVVVSESEGEAMPPENRSTVSSKRSRRKLVKDTSEGSPAPEGSSASDYDDMPGMPSSSSEESSESEGEAMPPENRSTVSSKRRKLVKGIRPRVLNPGRPRFPSPARVGKGSHRHDNMCFGGNRQSCVLTDSEFDSTGSDADSESADDQPLGHGRVYVTPDSAGTLVDVAWAIVRDRGSSMCTITERVSHQPQYIVHKTRLKKATLALRYSAMLAALLPGKCKCAKTCYVHAKLEDVQDVRKLVNSQPSEQAINKVMAAKFRNDANRWKIADRYVCRAFWCQMTGLSEAKAKKIRTLAMHGHSACAGPRARPVATNTAKSDVAFAFWNLFFENNCQRPNAETRLFPVNKTYTQIYEDYFVPWLSKQNLAPAVTPSFTTWRRARYDDAFRDVKRRARHNHCRCETCACLSAQLLAAFSNAVELDKYKMLRRIHDASVVAWRQLERVKQASAINTPTQCLTLTHDGTGAIGYPRLTGRSPKNLTKSKHNVIPWLVMNHSTSKLDYVYMTKKRWVKGANYLITMLHAVIARHKSDYSHPGYAARKLCAMADNASDNKNNTLLAYCCCLIRYQWFDEIELLFGMVGHTHTSGVDANHAIHNDKLGNLDSFDFGHFLRNYPRVYHQDHSRPRASVLDVMADWVKYFRDYLRPLMGFTKTKYDPEIVRGWRIFRNTNGEPEITWKMDPASSEKWRGQDGQEGSTGYFILKGYPPGHPEPVAPADSCLQPKYANQLISTSMARVMSMHDAGEHVAFNHQCAVSGVIPVGELLEGADEVPPGEWGPLVAIGAVPSRRGKARIIQELWRKDGKLFDLPRGEFGEHTVALGSDFHASNDAGVNRPTAIVRYQGVRAENAPVYNLPANVAGRAEDQAIVEANEAQEVVRADEVPSIGNLPSMASSNLVGAVNLVALSSVELDVVAADDDNVQPSYVFTVPFEPTVGDQLLQLVEYNAGPGISLGVILSIDKEGMSCQVCPMQCTADRWEETCLVKIWHKKSGACSSHQTHEKVDHSSAIFYGKALTKGNKLSAKAKKYVVSADISWTIPDVPLYDQ